MSDKPEEKKTVAEILEKRLFKTPSELIQERCNDYYNEGVDACIERIKIHDEYVSIGFMDDLIKQLEQLKKP